MKNITIAVIIIAVLAAGAVYAWPKVFGQPKEDATPGMPSPSPEPLPRPCTMEAKLCPDGSAVGRSGPNCEFAPCGSPTPMPKRAPAPTQEPMPAPTPYPNY